MHRWKHNRSKPVIGITGGIGSGKSTVAQMFASQGCAVIDSDRLAHEVLQSREVKEELLAWLGQEVFNADGSVNRREVAKRVFADASQTERLNGLIHPRVDRRRRELMEGYLADDGGGGVGAVGWGVPLLFGVGLNRECDAVIFVDVPRPIRLRRLRENRGWTAEELDRREKLQFPLDKKAQLADYCMDNSSDQASTLRLVQQVLSQILAPSV
ncbi:MAG: dephospho-CoA kinase [Phycisphaerales bacterium]|nr:dephospho-CoA kinase [Phycisphaerales bacterium]